MLPITLDMHICNFHAYILGNLKRQLPPNSKIFFFHLTCSAFYQSRLLWCELSSFGDISHRDFSFSNIMGLNGGLNVGHTAPNKYI